MTDKVIPELHRPVPTDRIGPQGLENTVNASASERAALAAAAWDSGYSPTSLPLLADQWAGSDVRGGRPPPGASRA